MRLFLPFHPLSCAPSLPLQVSHATGYFELQLVSVDNPKGQLLSGDCCDAEKSAAEGHCGADECDTYFRVCLKEYQTEVTTSGPCTYGSETTKVIGGNTFQFRGSQKAGPGRNSDAGKIIIPFQFAWPVSGSPCHLVAVEIRQFYVNSRENSCSIVTGGLSLLRKLCVKVAK